MTWIKEFFYFIRKFPKLFFMVTFMPWRHIEKCHADENDYGSEARNYTYFTLALWLLLKADRNFLLGEASASRPSVDQFVSNFWTIIVFSFCLVFYLLRMAIYAVRNLPVLKNQMNRISLDIALNLSMPFAATWFLFVAVLRFVFDKIDGTNEAIVSCSQQLAYRCLYEKGVILESHAYSFEMVDLVISGHFVALIAGAALVSVSNKDVLFAGEHLPKNIYLATAVFSFMYLAFVAGSTFSFLGTRGW